LAGIRYAYPTFNAQKLLICGKRIDRWLSSCPPNEIITRPQPAMAELASLIRVG
jgi:hypothetical protein